MPDDLGTCCACGCEPSAKNPVRTLVMLDYKMPPGSGPGWGCFQCGLPTEGACAVVCDDCAEKMRFHKAEPRLIMTGVDDKRGRLAIDSFEKVPHLHDISKHPEVRRAG